MLKQSAPNAKTAVLKVLDGSKSFGNTKIFSDVSFELYPGEIVCIKGKSGEGKTTLLRAINSLEQLDSGTIEINGRILSLTNKEELRNIRQDIGFVFQNFNLFPHMTVWENLVEAPLYLKNSSKEEIDARASMLLEELEISARKDAYPGELSGGQKQRVAIARACMLDPKILCFDEPTSAVDESTRSQISNIIRWLANRGIAIIIVTHDNTFVDEISDRVFLMSDGKLLEEESKAI